MEWSREEKSVCPLCIGGQSKLIGHKMGKAIKEQFEIRRCNTCDLIYVSNPVNRKH